MRIKTSCTRDCPDACGIVATVEDGRAIKLQGDPDHPVTRGFLCYRTSRFLERQYDPERLTTPMLRHDGEFRPVSWARALERVASKLLEVRDRLRDGAQEVAQVRGNVGVHEGVETAADGEEHVVHVVPEAGREGPDRGE